MKMPSLKPMTQRAKQRRLIVLDQLNAQLVKGVKLNKGTTAEKRENSFVPLTDKDIKRINKVGVNNCAYSGKDRTMYVKNLKMAEMRTKVGETDLLETISNHFKIIGSYS